MPKKKTYIGSVPLKPSGLMGQAARKIAKRKASTSAASTAKKATRDTGGKTTAKSPPGVQKTKAQGAAEKAALRKKQLERAKKLKNKGKK